MCNKVSNNPDIVEKFIEILHGYQYLTYDKNRSEEAEDCLYAKTELAIDGRV
ncbi:MAG: hypothetical protein OXI43_13555 [Candidatus Poribacteria bacterium]|nr:hypothetical protein [Candidatus Poribacteria bacterium]